jgi:uncharacterized protein HemY
MRYSGVILVVIATVLLPLTAGGQTDDDTARKEARRAQIRQCRAILQETLRQFETGDYDSARVLLLDARKCDPKNPDVFFHSARVALHFGDTTKATSLLHDGIAAAPLSSRLKLYLARLRLAAGAAAAADSLVSQVLAIKPREGEALYLKGEVLLYQGDSTQALDYWQRAVERGLKRRRR